MNSQTSQQSLAGIRCAFATVALDAAGIGIIFPIMPELLLSLGINQISEAALWGGVMATVYALMQFLFAPLLGNLSDRYGRRPVMLTSLAAMAIDYTILSFAGGLFILIIGRTIAGICGATHATASAYIADFSSHTERAKRFGQLGAVFGLGFVLGPALGGIVGEWHVRAPFLLAALLAALNFLLSYFYLVESLPQEKRRAFDSRRANPFRAIARVLKLPAINTLLFGFLLFALGNHVYPVIWSYWGKATFNWSATTIGITIAAYGVAMAISQGFIMPCIVDRFGEAKTVLIGLVTGAFGAFCFGFADATWMVFSLLPLAALSELASPALTAIMSKRVADTEQGELQGILTSVLAITNFVSPAIYTGIFYYFTASDTPVDLPGAPYILAAVLVFLVMPVVWHSLHRQHD